MFQVQVTGLKELVADLNAMSARVRRNTLVEALEEGAEPIRVLMARHAPHEPGPPDIKDAMIVSRHNRTIGEEGVLARQDEFQATVAVGPERGFFYGIFQEYGTVRHRAKPFARPAFDEGAPKSLAIIAKSLWLLISERKLFRPKSIGGGS